MRRLEESDEQVEALEEQKGGLRAGQIWCRLDEMASINRKRRLKEYQPAWAGLLCSARGGTDHVWRSVPLLSGSRRRSSTE
jgi:hypothetical protein